VRFAGVALALIAALLVQTTIARFVFGGAVSVDFVLVVVVFAGLKAGPVAGLLAGTFGGIVQDSLASGIIGVGSLAKTVVGFLAGVMGTQFILAQPGPRFVVFALASVAHSAIVVGTYEMLGAREFGWPGAALGLTALGNAIIGVLAFQAAELLPGAMERRRASRPRLRR